MIWHHTTRVLCFIAGLFLIGLGLAMSIRIGLGTMPVGSLPAVLSFGTPLSLGFYVIVLNLMFIALQYAILRSQLSLKQLVQIPIAMSFGIFADLGMFLTQWLQPEHYVTQWIWLVISVLVVALGIYLETQPKLSYLPGDGLVVAIATKMPAWKFGTIKIYFDATLVLCAVTTSWIMLDQVAGVREGTIFAALATGAAIRLITTIHQKISGSTQQ